MSRFAKSTLVSQERTRLEIERMILKYGADRFAYSWSAEGNAVIGFQYQKRMIKFTVPMPDRKDHELTETGRARAPDVVTKHWEQAGRQRWRALLLIIKAKLEAIESGVTTFENEFLAFTMLPTGETFGELATATLDQAIEAGKAPRLLPASFGR